MRITPKQRDVLFVLQVGGELCAPLCDDSGWWLTHNDFVGDGLSVTVQDRTVRTLQAKGLIDVATWRATITDAGRDVLADAIAA